MSGLIAFMMFLLFVLTVVGYGWNIVKLSQSKAFCGMDALRVIGIIFPPMGAVFGYVG